MRISFHSDLHLKLGPKDGIRLHLSVYESHKGTTIHTPPLKNNTMLPYSSGNFIRAESMFICDKRTNWEVNTCMAERKGQEIPNKFLVIYTAWIMFKGRITKKNFVTEYQNNKTRTRSRPKVQMHHKIKKQKKISFARIQSSKICEIQVLYNTLLMKILTHTNNVWVQGQF